MTNSEKCKQAFGALHAKENICVSDKMVDLSCNSHNSWKKRAYVAIALTACVCVVTNVLPKIKSNNISISNQKVSNSTNTGTALSQTDIQSDSQADNKFDNIESNGTIITPLEIIMDSSQLYIKLRIRIGNDAKLDKFMQNENYLQLIDDKMMTDENSADENSAGGISEICERIQLRNSYDMVEVEEDNTIIYTAYFWNYNQNSQPNKLHFDGIGIVKDGKITDKLASGSFDIPLDKCEKSTKKSFYLKYKNINIVCTNLACYIENDMEVENGSSENGEISYSQIGKIEAVMADGNKVEYDWKYGIWEKPIDIEQLKSILIDGKEQKIW